jgi:phosphoribosylglycinamide formyltransferase-1
MSNYRVALFASGSGTNAEAIMTHFKNHTAIAVVGVLTNNPQAYVLTRAVRFNVPTFVFNRQQLHETGEVLAWLNQHRVTHVVLAGFLWLVPASIIQHYSQRIINIHPALLPAFGGKGMYGMRVHEAVKAAGAAETGITIHLVNDRYDEGKILLQARTQLTGSETPEQIAQKVHALEYLHYPDVIEKWIRNS